MSPVKEGNLRGSLGPLLVFCAAVLWSFAGLGIRHVSWSPLSIACARGLLAAGVLWVFHRRTFKRPTPSVWLGALGIFCTSTLFLLCNRLTTTANAIVLQYTAPAFVIVLSALFLRSRPKRADILAVLFTLAGVLLFFLDHLGHGALLGDLLALLSGLTFSLVFFSTGMPGSNPAQAAFLGNLLDLLLLPFLFTDPRVSLSPASDYIIVLLLGIFQLGLAYVLFSAGSRRTSPVTASVICTIEPILSPLWVFFVLGEAPGALAVAGMSVVILSVTLYNIVLSRQRSREQVST